MKNKNQNEEEKPNYVDMEQTAFKMTYQKQEWIRTIDRELDLRILV